MSELCQKLQPYLDRAFALASTCTLFNWDQYSAPKESIENTAKIIGILSGEQYRVLINDQVKELLPQLSTEDAQKELSFHEKAIVRLLNKQYDKLSLIPPEEYS